jgi:hypothetical protein
MTVLLDTASFLTPLKILGSILEFYFPVFRENNIVFMEKL